MLDGACQTPPGLNGAGENCGDGSSVGGTFERTMARVVAARRQDPLVLEEERIPEVIKAFHRVGLAMESKANSKRAPKRF